MELDVKVDDPLVGTEKEKVGANKYVAVRQQAAGDNEGVKSGTQAGRT